MNTKGLARSCHLISDDAVHKPIPIADQTPIVIGRKREFKINEKSCSREQVEITADYKDLCATVKQLGVKPSYIGERVIGTNNEMRLEANETLFIIGQKCPYHIEFLMEKDAAERAQKRKITDVLGEKEDGNGGRKQVKTQRDSDDDGGDGDDNIDEAAAKLKQLKKTFSMLPPEKKSLSVSSSSRSGTSGSGTAGSGASGSGASGNGASGNATESRRSVNGTCGSGMSVNGTSASGAAGSPAEKSEWSKRDTMLVYVSAGLKASNKIAAFDLDGTIITPKSGKVFPTNPNDWKIRHVDIPKKIKQKFADGFKIVLITNQLVISKGRCSVWDFQRKIEQIIQKLGVPAQLMAATTRGRYRKPYIGMWQYLIEESNDGIVVDMNQSLYVGDAAGRPEDKGRKRKKDFSCSDRLFALNLGLAFQTPEEFFLGEKPQSFNLPEFDPRSAGTDVCGVDQSTWTSDKQEMIICVGFPASGKSYFSKHILAPAGYVIICRDQLGSWNKCVEKCKLALSQGEKVVVDNTNPDLKSRRRYVEIAQKAGVTCRCFLFTATINQAKHNELFRQLIEPGIHANIYTMVMNVYKSNYAPPTVSEGFAQVLRIPFVPNFKNETDEKIYRMFLHEK